MSQHDDGPVLNYDDSAETAATLHMWTQIVGKIRMERTPWLNYFWHVTLYVTPMRFLETTFAVAVEHAKWDLGPIRRRHFAS